MTICGQPWKYTAISLTMKSTKTPPTPISGWDCAFSTMVSTENHAKSFCGPWRFNNKFSHLTIQRQKGREKTLKLWKHGYTRRMRMRKTEILIAVETHQRTKKPRPNHLGVEEKVATLSVLHTFHLLNNSAYNLWAFTTP